MNQSEIQMGDGLNVKEGNWIARCGHTLSCEKDKYGDKIFCYIHCETVLHGKTKNQAELLKTIHLGEHPTHEVEAREIF